jgi:Kef-type K+ transport system membrane component KefB
MLPSESDRRDWVPLVIFLLALFLVVYFAGAWDAIQPYFVTWLDRILSAAGMVFAFSLAVLFAAVIPLWLLHQILGRLMRVKTGW